MIISEDIGEDNRYVPNIQAYLLEMGIRRLISIPLIHNGAVLGALNIGFTELSTLDADTRATLETIGKTIGLALANVRGLEQLRAEIAEREKAEHLQKVLFEISRASSRSDKLSGLLAEVRSQIGELLDSKNFFVALYDERKEIYSFPFWEDDNDSLGWEAQKLTGSLTDYVRRRGAGAIIDRAEHEALIAKGEASLIGTQSECWMGVPLKTRNNVIGVMVVQSYGDSHTYNQADLDLLSYVGENIAWVIENKRIEEELRTSEATALEFQAKLRELLEISFELSRLESIDDVCLKAVMLGRERLGYDRMGLFLVDLEKDLLFGMFGTDAQGVLRDEREFVRPLSAEWAMARVIREGRRSYIWDNVPLNDDWKAVGHGWNGMAVIWDGDKGIGSIAVDNLLSRQAIRPYEQELLGLYGIVLGYVISSKRAETARKRIVEHLRIVNSVEQAILAAASPRAIAEVVVERLEDFLHCDYVSIFSIDEESRMMHMLAWSVEDTGLRNFPLHEASLLDVERLEMGRTSVFPDLTQLENLSETENVLIGWGIRSFVIIPLLVDDILVGTLNLGMKSLNAFGEEQIAIAHEVATQLSVAIRQARLLEQVQAYASDLETQVKVRTEQLEAKASELEAFTYSVSHDLRQPLRAMSGFAEVLISDFAGELNDEAKHYLERIRHNAQRMGTLIDDLLGLSRVGRRELSKTEIAPDSILKEIVSELEGDGQIGNAKIQIQAMPSCKADPVLLKQLWLNLLTNAIKYSKKHEQPEIIIGAKQERQETVYFIQDNGVGFDMQYAEKLFGVFQRLHSSSEYEGTGIGLATVHRIVERHGGRIWAQAGIDKGASFFFVLGKA
jgi:signal transduction histidine kinase